LAAAVGRPGPGVDLVVKPVAHFDDVGVDAVALGALVGLVLERKAEEVVAGRIWAREVIAAVFREIKGIRSVKPYEGSNPRSVL
jgi:hypothetical protein